VDAVTRRASPPPARDDQWLIVGLGNPGRQYAHNRHNVGYMVVDVLADRIGVRFSRHKRASAEAAEGRLGYAGGPRLLLVKPTTYMNLSGQAVSGLARFYKLPPQRIIAVHDDLDLAYGTLRAKQGGGEGGHNGLRSMTSSLSTKDYYRVRFGIGRPPGRRDPADWVLSDFSAAERKDLDYLVDRAADFVEAILTDGLEPAQNRFHAG
jgi:PTH1 family peptidyl-tRNA hydrolase